MSILSMKNWRDYPDGKEKYKLYLASREWAVLKEAVKKRSGGTCERCSNALAEQTHHQTYERLYKEPITDLVHLCPPCHEFISGKLDRDPILSTPVILMGRAIRNVYLAGKITGTKWRDQIAAHEGWSVQNDGIIDFDNEGYSWETVDRCLPIPDGRRLNLAGPFWRALPLGGHATIGNTEGPHAFTTVCEDIGKHGEEVIHRDSPDLLKLASTIRNAIERSDLLFAWIDSPDCFGTLVEMGYARGLHRIIVTAFPTDFDASELWLAHHFSHIHGTHDSPAEAWRALWSNPRLRVDPAQFPC